MEKPKEIREKSRPEHDVQAMVKALRFLLALDKKGTVKKESGKRKEDSPFGNKMEKTYPSPYRDAGGDL